MSRPERVAVVWNRSRDGILFRGHRPSPERYGKRTIRKIVETLAERYDTVAAFEGDATLLDELAAFLGADDRTEPPGMVLNLAYGVQGDERYTHVPGMLEMAGVPYTGAAPLGHAVSLDKVTAKTLMRAAGVPTPDWALAERPDPAIAERLCFPLIVKPRHESTSHGIELVHDERELNDAIEQVVGRYRQAALVERYVAGRELCVGLLGNSPPQVLPAVELDFSSRHLRLMTFDDKYHRRDDEPEKLCPAPLDPAHGAELERIALATFKACHCRDYARVDVRLDEDGRPWVLEINSMASLGSGGSYVRAAEVAGLDFSALLERIIETAWQRHVSSRAATAAAAA